MDIRRKLKNLLYEQVERLAKGVASAKRLELIELLCQSPKAVETLAEEAGISMKLASAHLRELRLVHLVEAERDGRNVIYRIACAEVAGVLVRLRGLAEQRSHEMQDMLRRLEALAAPKIEIDYPRLRRQARAGTLMLLDVRPADEYRAGHLPRALSFPLAELPRRLDELPRERMLVVYCRGPFSFLADEATRLLVDAGFNAYQWCTGAADWLAAEDSLPQPIRGDT
ncbi:hypothetical protein APA73_00600 [Pseudomonas aeruginosa]|uniref:ArsR/SmtB family transcription factor n=1 Tax=Pseudomonas aeruginosa TaxID=287 RepID=UPI000451AF45|nr:rhodanese-like domain-containing protein [Pseudomonas aeruginosa]ETV24896.1 hypothetical protein Q048_03820 [Pseudomonas aeruginosa BWHPSA043]KHE31687.1 hypothetical protein LH31_28310 [Pseudomonas aeruginosa]KSL77193.1 hypothetical protein APA58_00600 [Pseudomonas aeruginosa]KSM91644.1 hypothetical protein APA73_00600 [Pseudomonas aeruginosa]MBO3771994.1 ArsR family transcriptional regulator [Pseudomonas aeruginosa]